MRIIALFVQGEKMGKRKHKVSLRRKIWNYINEHPSLDRILDKISELNNKFMIAYFTGVFVLVAAVVIIAYFTLSKEIRNEVTPIIGAIFSVVIVPLVLNVYNRKKDNEFKRFEMNKEMYIQLAEMLSPFIIEKEYTKKDVDKFEKFIEKNYSQMYISFQTKLILDIISVYRNCTINNHGNVKYYSSKCLKEIRKECSIGKEIYVPALVEEILQEKLSN